MHKLTIPAARLSLSTFPVAILSRHFLDFPPLSSSLSTPPLSLSLDPSLSSISPFLFAVPFPFHLPKLFSKIPFPLRSSHFILFSASIIIMTENCLE